MNADRSQAGNQRPDEAPHSPGGFHDAPTTSPTRLPSPTPGASGHLLFGRLALHNGFIDQETLDNALAQQQAAQSQSLADILVQKGLLSDEERRGIELLCELHVAKHGDNRKKSLDSLTLAPTVSYRHPPGADTVTFTQKPTDGKQPQGTFGDYELLGEIARGGMGRPS
jgi:hypothetical protein